MKQKLSNKIMLITYPDCMGNDFKDLAFVLDRYLEGAVGGLHILPFFPSSADRGFSPTTYREVDPRFGDWEDIRKFSEKYYLMYDYMINHISDESEVFKDFIEKKDESEYRDFFIRYKDFWEGGEPTEEQESRLYDHLVKYANRLPGYVSEVNACVTTFEQTCLSTDYNARVQGRSSCMSLFNTLLSEFVAVRDYPRSNYSRYAKAHDDLINMYRCLFSYVDNYVDAWDANLAYEDPSGHVDDFMAPLYANMVNGKNQYLAEFEVSYQGFTL